jgi:hypothetical protein
MREAALVGEQQTLTLPAAQELETTAQCIVRGGEFEIVGRSLDPELFGLCEFRGAKQYHWAAGALQVDGAIARNGDHPGHRPTLDAIVLAGLLPDANERILQGIFGRGAGTEYAHQNGQKSWCGAPIERLQGLRVLASAAQQQIVKLIAVRLPRHDCSIPSLRFLLYVAPGHPDEVIAEYGRRIQRRARRCQSFLTVRTFFANHASVGGPRS